MKTLLKVSALTAVTTLVLACGGSSGEGPEGSSGTGSAGSGGSAGAGATSSSSGGSAGSGGSEATGGTAAAGGEGASDGGAGGDAAPFPTCLGTSVPVELVGTTLFTNVTVGSGASAVTGAFLIDYGSGESQIDPSAFAAPGPTATSCTGSADAGPFGQHCTYPAFDFITNRGSVSLLTEDFPDNTSPRQTGIVGTDLLSYTAFTLDYTDRKIYMANAAFCADAELIGAGFVAMSTAGFFAHNPATLKPKDDFAPADAGVSIPNSPEVTVSFAGATASAMVDTGFDDAGHPGAVNINAAFLAAIVGQDDSALVRDPSLDQTLTTCTGEDEQTAAYRPTAGKVLEFIATDGSVARSVSSAVFYLKPASNAETVCGGIGAWTVPAAQLGASFDEGAGMVVFDPITSRVWIPKG
jgi:hypothetical protein